MASPPGGWPPPAGAVLFGLIALVWPTITLLALVVLFGAYVLVDGLIALAVAAPTRSCSASCSSGSRSGCADCNAKPEWSTIDRRRPELEVRHSGGADLRRALELYRAAGGPAVSRIETLLVEAGDAAGA